MQILLHMVFSSKLGKVRLGDHEKLQWWPPKGALM